MSLVAAARSLQLCEVQDFAWTEQGAAAKLQQRVDKATEPHERELLAASPMFCFETAVKLHRQSPAWLH